MTRGPPLSRKDKVSIQRSVSVSSVPALVYSLSRMHLFHSRVRDPSGVCELHLLQVLSTRGPR